MRWGYTVTMNVLVVEDEKQLAGFIRKGLEEQGFSVDLCHDGDEGHALAMERAYDVLVLDIMLPGRDGLSILSSLRRHRRSIPVILLTARSALNERLEGLNLGADDYLTKPFYVEELIARIQALLRRHGGHHTLLEQGELRVDMIAREVRVEEERVELTVREFSLLEYLMRSPGRVFSRTQILEHVWGFNIEYETNIIDVHVKRLRGKLCAEDRERYIETVRGVGYRFRKVE